MLLMNGYKRYMRAIVAFGVAFSISHSAYTETELTIELVDEQPLVTWSNEANVFFELLSESSPITETPFFGSGTTNSWAPSPYDGDRPIIVGLTYDYRFRIISISNDVVTQSAQIKWVCRTGNTYRILRTSSPSNWVGTLLATNLTFTNTVGQFSDNSAGLGPQYYAVEMWISNQWLRSENAVGFYTTHLPATTPDNPSQLHFLRVDFSPVNGNNFTLQDLLGSLFPEGSEVYMWTDAYADSPFFGTRYVTSTRTATGWSPNFIFVERGQAFIVGVKEGQPAATISFRGELPANSYASTTDLSSVNFHIPGGLVLMGYPYPQEVYFTNLALFKEGKSGDVLSIWDEGMTQFVNYTRFRAGWTPSPTNKVLKNGESYFIRFGTNTEFRTAQESKPYSWP